ncbi:VOC family protein [Nocardiopsis alba]|uniref:VOC family protein n=1 Tax=Nocardiopsis alba TaxID=53437 RepID=UPI0005A6F93B|nr:VOC family protein [Nocardiopsis alba]
MTLRFVQVNIKALDAPRLGRFWAEAVGWEFDDSSPGEINLEPAGFDYPNPSDLVIDLVPVEDPKTVKNRVHIDLTSRSSEHQAETVRRLKALGATPVDIGQGDSSWVVLADPEGNEFCVLAPDAPYEGTGPIGAIAVDCRDPEAMVRFWDAATDWTVHEVNEDYARMRSSTGIGPYVDFFRVPEEKTVVNRVHLDLRPYADGDREKEADRLCELGATRVNVGQEDVPWTVMADPEGNEFCVLTPK